MAELRFSVAEAGTVGVPAKPVSAAVYDIFHELGTTLEDQTLEKTIEIDPARPPSEVIIRSHVVSTGAKALKSPKYLATIRRRKARRIATLVMELEAHAGSEEFAVWSQEPLEKLRQLIQELSDAEQYSCPEHEGNSCEILRQLRDTFLNTGWEGYRESDVRKVVFDILDRLATIDEVSGEDASHVMDQLLDSNLNPTVGFLCHDGEEQIPG